MLRRPINALSSNFVIAAGVWSMCSTIHTESAKMRKESLAYLASSVFVLGLASLLWWGSLTEPAWFLDVHLMETTVICIGALLFKGTAASFLQRALLPLLVGFWGLCIATEESSCLLELVALVIAGAGLGLCLGVVDACVINSPKFICALTAFLCGFVAKLLDVRHGFASGTLFLHLFGAIGYVFIVEAAGKNSEIKSDPVSEGSKTFNRYLPHIVQYSHFLVVGGHFLYWVVFAMRCTEGIDIAPDRPMRNELKFLEGVLDLLGLPPFAFSTEDVVAACDRGALGLCSNFYFRLFMLIYQIFEGLFHMGIWVFGGWALLNGSPQKSSRALSKYFFFLKLEMLVMNGPYTLGFFLGTLRSFWSCLQPGATANDFLLLSCTCIFSLCNHTLVIVDWIAYASNSHANITTGNGFAPCSPLSLFCRCFMGLEPVWDSLTTVGHSFICVKASLLATPTRYVHGSSAGNNDKPNAENLQDQLSTSGFVLFTDLVSGEEGRAFVEKFRIRDTPAMGHPYRLDTDPEEAADRRADTAYNYSVASQFAEDTIFPRLMQRLQLPKVLWSHFLRFSNGTNVDATVHHTDFKFLSKEREVKNLFTVVFYYDGGELGVIPGSHKHFMGPEEGTMAAYGLRAQREVHRLPAFSVGLFHSNLLHRGIYTNMAMTTQSRGLLQLFGCHITEGVGKGHGWTYQVPFPGTRGFDLILWLTKKLHFLDLPDLVDFPRAARRNQPIGQGLKEETIKKLLEKCFDGSESQKHPLALFYETRPRLKVGQLIGPENIYVYPHENAKPRQVDDDSNENEM